MASRTASETWSASLSGWPSATDSEVKSDIRAYLTEPPTPARRPLRPAAAPGARLGEVRLRPFLPGVDVLLLLRGEGVDGNPHRLQLQPGDVGVDLMRDVVHAVLERAARAGQPLRRERLVGEAHVHHGRRVALGRGQVDEPALADDVEPAAVLQPVLLDELPHLADGGGDVVHGRQVDPR